MSFYKHHVFFCTNQRTDGRASCQDHQAQEMRDYLKKKIKEYKLNGLPVEYQDDRKNTILEVSQWNEEEKSIEVKNIYLEKGFTILNKHKLFNDDQECHHELKLVSPDQDDDIIVNLVYTRVNNDK